MRAPNHGYTYVDRVRPDEDGRTAEAFYSTRHAHTDRAGWRARMLAGRIERAGHALEPDSVVHAGDVLRYHRPPWIEPPVPRNFTVAYDDGDLVAVEKPAGLGVLADAMHLEGTLLALVRAGVDRSLSPIHRIDRGTSGLVLFARSREARRALSLAMASGHVRRRYRARVVGAGVPERAVIDRPLAPTPYAPTRTLWALATSPAARGARPAQTDLRVLTRDRTGDTALCLVEIRTGRPHQIRVHLASIGHPIAGDRLYAANGAPRRASRPVLPGDGGYALHAAELAFVHPVHGTGVRVRSTPPRTLRTAGDVS